MSEALPTYYEFFAGGGMARAGLGSRWRCVFANDFNRMKAATYSANWGGSHFRCEDVAKLAISDLPGRADLVWASFPCQDLSLAGDCAGLGRPGAEAPTRSGIFWPFWALMRGLRSHGRAPRVIVLENVLGVLTSHNGKDFAAIGEALGAAGYRFGALVIDAVNFVPQSRPRVFFVAVESAVDLPQDLVGGRPSAPWHPRAIVDAYAGLPSDARKTWAWWRLPIPNQRTFVLDDIVEDVPSGVVWHTAAETARLLEMMSPLNRAKVDAVRREGRRVVGSIYRRTRLDASGCKLQRAEVRFDGISGCLRTPSGGSSRQTLLILENGCARSRLISPREAARLMGLDDDYKLPSRYNDAYHVAGDGVCPGVVRHLARHLLEPLALAREPPGLRLMSAA